MLDSGTRFGSYEIRSPLGSGGMGEVYRARDALLGRDVAVKILPDAFAADPERLARFEREARVLAALNHPHIAAIHGLEDGPHGRALILELVEGPTLAERLRTGALPVGEALDVARQIAEALEAAHEKGIVHRDLKPANVKVTPDGMVKVLDFGIAKMRAPLEEAAAAEASTVTTVGTRPGVVLGTAAYMSPEQARGQAVDKRTDVWTFGCVLYELLTGRRAFAGKTVSDTIAAVLEREPDWSRLPPTTPAAVRRVLRRCLEKDAKQRLRDIGDARVELNELESLPEGTTGPGRKSQRHLLWMSVIGATAALVLVASFLTGWDAAGPARPASIRFPFSLAPTELQDAQLGGTPVPSPDGLWLAFVVRDGGGQTRLWVRPLNSLTAIRLAGTDGASNPIWSDDGRWIGFVAGGRLRKISVDGGAPQTVNLPHPNVQFSLFSRVEWNQHGDMLFFSNRTPVMWVRETGGAPAPVTVLNESRGENSHRWPQFLPDGRRFLYTARSAVAQNDGIYVGSLDSTDRTLLIPVGSNARYVASSRGGGGWLLFVRDGTLLAQAFRPDTLVLSGGPVPIAHNVAFVATSRYGAFEASANGDVIVYREGEARESRLSWYDREGQALGAVGPTLPYTGMRISPDATRVLFSRPDDRDGNRDVWSLDLVRGVATRLTVNPANNWRPVWSPDGRRFVFGSDRADGRTHQMYEKSLDANAPEQPLAGGTDTLGASPEDWSADGRWISTTRDLEGRADIWIVPALGDRPPFPFLETSSREVNPRFSPDTKWIAFASDESGQWEIHVRAFDGTADSGAPKFQVSVGGGDFPLWSRDGQELFYISTDLELSAVTLTGFGQTQSLPAPRVLFRPCADTRITANPFAGTPWEHPYDVTPDGRFLFVCSAHSGVLPTVAVGWQSDLEDGR